MGDIVDQKEDLRPDGGDSAEGGSDDTETQGSKPDNGGFSMDFGSGIMGKTRDFLGNLTSDSARERTGRARQASRTVRGKRSRANAAGDPSPRVLQSKASNHAEDARQRNRTIKEELEDFDEGLSQTAEQIEDELEEFVAYGEQEVSESLQWDYNPDRSLDTGEESGESLFSYMADRSAHLEDVFEKITNVNGTIDTSRDRKEELESELEDKREEMPEEEERVRVEQRNNMTASEAREADLDEIAGFADDVADSKEAHIGNQIEDLKDQLDKVNKKISSLEGRESALYDARNEIVDEIEEVYEPHAEAMEETVRALSEELEEGIGYLEALGSMELPNLTEEQGTSFVDAAEAELQRTRQQASDAVVSRIGELATYLANIEKEHSDLVSVLPDQYVEDGEFQRIDIADEVLSGVSDELAGSYDTVMDRIDTAYQEATGESVYEAFDDAESTIAHLRAGYADEVAE